MTAARFVSIKKTKDCPMARWQTIRSHYLFRVALGYVALVWLLALAIVVVFPMLEQPPGTVTTAISLLVAGLPLVMAVAWVFAGRSADRAVMQPSAGSGAELSRLMERAIIVVLVIAIATIGVRQVLIEGRAGSPGDIPIEPDAAASAPTRSISIGILSPKEGSRLVPTGKAHEASAMLGFERMGQIRMGSTIVDVQFIPWNDEGDPKTSSELALKLANEQGVAAVVGAVTSGSTASVLSALRAEDIELPVISSLSTAKDLIVSGKRDSNFFRLIFDDAGRMARLARFIENDKRNQGQHKFLFAYDDEAYGRGLVNDLASNFYSENYETVTWCKLAGSNCASSKCNADGACADQPLDTELYDSIAEANGIDAAWAQRLSDLEFDNVVLLGTVPGSLAFSQGIKAIQDRIDFYLVGSNKQLFDEAPIGSVAIGNPVLDPVSAPNAELMAEWNEILTLFEEKYGQDPADFVVTAYEAGLVLNSALRSVLENRQDVPPLPQLRREILRALESQSFDSVEPWRTIEFVDGRLRESPAIPIYRIARGPLRIDTSEPRSWVEIDMPREFSYMEGPIRARLRGNGVNSVRVMLTRMDAGRANVIRTKEVVFSANEAIVDFHVFRTGTYRLSVQGVAYTPSPSQTRMILAPTYAVSLITALLGAVVVVLRGGSPLRTKLIRVLLGMFAGFALTFSALYGAKVAGWFPFPKFGDEPYVNAIVTGLIGGLVGPYALAEVFLSWALTLAPRHTGRQNGPKDLPEGL
jgi:ABC-type branched-subunit amino acid transport system substrate-binding protein